jgi:trehalose 6-phosphate synthase
MLGAAEVLSGVCRSVNPFDVSEQAEAIAAALLASPEERAASALARREAAEPWTLERWVDTQLASLDLR